MIPNELNERGVSPVIGVILMVAITVILAAVIGAFVLGIGPDQDPAPQGTFTLAESEDPNEIIVRHRGGDRLDYEDLTIRLDETASTDDDGPYTVDPNNPGTADTDQYGLDPAELRQSTGADRTVEFGDIDGDTGGDTIAVEVTIIHEPSDSIILDRTVDMEFDNA